MGEAKSILEMTPTLHRNKLMNKSSITSKYEEIREALGSLIAFEIAILNFEMGPN